LPVADGEGVGKNPQNNVLLLGNAQKGYKKTVSSKSVVSYNTGIRQ